MGILNSGLLLVRVQSHQILLAVDLWIPPMLFNENVADIRKWAVPEDIRYILIEMHWQNPQSRFWCDCSLRVRSHQNLLAADLWIPPMLFNGKVAEICVGT